MDSLSKSRKRGLGGARPGSQKKRVRISREVMSPAEDVRSENSEPYTDESSETNEDHSSPSTAATPTTLSSPRRKYPSEEKIHHCPFDGCSKSFNRPARLAEHVRSHNNDRPFRCEQPGCDKDFLREAHLTHHIKSAHTTIRDHVCDIDGCEKSFLTATRLRRHKAAHEGRDKYRCNDFPPCNETFRKHSTLQKHITSVHHHKKPYPCTQLDLATSKPCNQAFDTAYRLRTHEGRVHGGLRFWCAECPSTTSATLSSGLGFPTYNLLQDHLRTIHPPTCTHCSLPCSTQRELRRHVEIVHSMEEDPSVIRPHACDHQGCTRSFSKKFNLTVHKRSVHDDERPFICSDDPACARAFKTKASLALHVRTAHHGLLNPRTKTARSLSTTASSIDDTIDSKKKKGKRSALTHLTGAHYADPLARPLTCPIPTCDFRFAREYDRTGHLRARHGLADAEIAMVGRDGIDGMNDYDDGLDDDDGQVWEDDEMAFDRFLDEHDGDVDMADAEMLDQAEELLPIDPALSGEV
ncbi:MAG: Strongly-conserved Zn-finger binding protein (TFIIIA) [Piccolia ochrophora]|nr:MAG: Strongly-conserved Zn-finger binding protein (TFIIIA) [Piccolia ochrophora]